MTCSKCGRKLTIVEAARTRCPHCDRPFDRQPLGLLKASSVRVAAGDTDRVYRSIEDLSPELRRQLQRAISGPDSETIVIADEQGRKQLFQVINGLPPHLRKKVLAAMQFPDPAGSRPAASPAWRWWLLAAGLVCLILLLWWIWR